MSDQTESAGREVMADEVRLLAAIQVLLSTPKARVALWLRFSRLPPGLPLPHHRRVAHTILEIAAQHHEGELFTLSSGDLVLLCRAPSHNGLEPAAHPAALPHTLSRLFHSHVSDVTILTQSWWLEHDGAALIAQVVQLMEGG